MILSVVFAGCAAFFFTFVLIKTAQKLGLVDHPNHRSMHFAATPRGGGIAFFLVFLGTSLWQWGSNGESWQRALLAGGSVIALLGLWDDRFRLKASVRLLVHLATASAVLPFVLAGTPERSALLWGAPHFVVFFTGVLFIAWLTNLYNFMDGIDGLAGLQCCIVSFFMAVFCLKVGDTLLAVTAMTLGASVAGFLFWNWSPARIFMGDVGSGFLGFFFGVTALVAAVRGSVPLPVSLLLLSPFFVDATVTLLRRALRWENVASAHREHCYQKLVQSGYSSPQVSLAFLFLTVFAGGISYLCLDAASTIQWVVCSAFFLLMSSIAIGIGAGLPEKAKRSVVATGPKGV